MNKYLMKTISVNGTEADFLKGVKDFFLTNTIMPFTLENENLTDTEGEANYIKLQNEDYKLEFTSTIDASSETGNSCVVTLYKNNENEDRIYSQSILYLNSYAQKRDYITNRKYLFFIVKGDNLTFLNIIEKSRYGAGTGLFHTKINTSEVGEICANTTSGVFMNYNNLAESYTIAPAFTKKTVMDELVINKFLEIKSSDNSLYVGQAYDCYSLGGGVQQNFYKDSDGNLFYCFAPNACFKLEEKEI